MVRFLGGAFLVGSASAYEASELGARDQVVLVLLQPRLGVLGLLRDEEKALSLQMMKYWAKFAHTGCLVPRHIWAAHLLSAGPTDQLLRNPNGGKLPYWPHYNKEKYLQMDFTTSVGVKLKEEEMAFRMRLHQH